MNPVSERISILGFPVDPVDMDGALAVCRRLIADARPHQVITANPLMLLAAETDTALAAAFREAALVVPDGAGLALAARLRGKRLPRVAGIDLMDALCGLAATEGGPRVTIEAEGPLDGLPAIVEVAAYRIATEAMTNAVRHADAGAIDVLLRATPDALEVRIEDDGRGIDPDVSPGVGLASMRERAAELGGWCDVEASARGTLVRAHLPVTREPALTGREPA